MNSLVRMGVSPTASTPTGFCSQRFWSFLFSCWNPGLHSLSRSPIVPPGLSTCKCRSPHPSVAVSPTWSASHLLAVYPLCPYCPSPPLLPIWMNVSSLTPWLLDFHTVWFSGISGCFLFLNLFLSFFWLCKEVKCVYLCLHLGRQSKKPFLLAKYFMNPLFTSQVISSGPWPHTPFLHW